MLNPRKRSWLEIIGIGGIATFLGFASFAIWFFARRQYRLVLRDEITFLGAPVLFIGAGMLCLGLAFWMLRRLAVAQNRRVKWVLKEGGKSSSRGGPVSWEDVLWATGPGVVLGVIGIGLWVNCAWDKSPARTHFPRLIKKYSSGSGGSRGGIVHYYFQFTDWKKIGGSVTTALDRDLYLAHQKGDIFTITTKKGLLGYEWVVDAK